MAVLAPALIIFSWFKFIPMIQGLVMSFYKVSFNQPNSGVGLDLHRAFADARAARGGGEKYPALRGGNDVRRGYPGVFLAMLLEGPARHLRFIRTAIFLPAVTMRDRRRNVAHFV